MARGIIRIPQPSMSLNAPGMLGARYRMSNNYDVPASHTIADILGWVAVVARATPEKTLKALIINCHGVYDIGPNGHWVGGFGLDLGTGVKRADTPKFAVIAGLVGTIYFTACGTARISGRPSGDGNLFCSEIAKASKAYVVAATTRQTPAMWLPENAIDSFEGLVLKYNPSGAVESSDVYPRDMTSVYHGMLFNEE